LYACAVSNEESNYFPPNGFFELEDYHEDNGVNVAERSAEQQACVEAADVKQSCCTGHCSYRANTQRAKELANDFDDYRTVGDGWVQNCYRYFGCCLDADKMLVNRGVCDGSVGDEPIDNSNNNSNDSSNGNDANDETNAANSTITAAPATAAPTAPPTAAPTAPPTAAPTAAPTAVETTWLRDVGCCRGKKSAKKTGNHESLMLKSTKKKAYTFHSALAECQEECDNNKKCTAFEVHKMKKNTKRRKSRVYKCELHMRDIDSTFSESKSCKKAECWIKL